MRYSWYFFAARWLVQKSRYFSIAFSKVSSIVVIFYKMNGENKQVANFDRSLDKWIAKSQAFSSTVEVRTCIPMQRRSILSVISSSESLGEDEGEVLTDNQWMAIMMTKDNKNQFRKNAATIKSNVVTRGAPRAM